MRIHFWVVLLVLVWPTTSFATKKQCQPYLDKLRNIQAQQRVGHSNSRARSLAEREQKARDTWWRCQQGKLKSKKKRRNKKAGNSQRPKRKAIAEIESPSVSYGRSLVIKGAYQGQKQQDWLNFYRQPAKCKKPKSTQVFAFCMEDRRRQQGLFERQWQ